MGLNKDSIQFLLSHINGDCIIYSREYSQVLFATCMVPFVRANINPLSQRDIQIQKEIEMEIKVKQKQSQKNHRKWGSNGTINTAATGLAGYEADLRKIDELKKIKELLLRGPQPHSFFV